MMIDIKLPFPDKIESHELHSFYASFLVRLFIIQRQNGYHIKITKKEFCKALKEAGFIKSRIYKTWVKIKPGVFFNYVCDDYVILRGKEAISNDGGFITYAGVDDLESISFYKFCQFVTETYALRPVGQTEEFRSEFRCKKKSPAYNREILKRSFEKKRGRGQRKIASQSGCSLKTVNKRVKRSKKLKTLKRYDALNGYRIRKTNLYFNLESKIYLSYNKSTTGKMRLLSLNPDHSSLVSNTALFLNNSISLDNATNDIYQNMYSLV